MNIEKLSIDLIRPYWRNPRNNTEGVNELKKSILKFGFKVPLVLDKDNVIITGHSRYLAVKQLMGQINVSTGNSERDIELSELNSGIVPVIIASDLSEVQAKEFRISDNRISELASWDNDKLVLELRELSQGEVVGFKEEELFSILEPKYLKIEDVSVEDLQKTSRGLESTFVERSMEHQADMLNIACPLCKNEFSLSRDEILNSKWVKKGEY